MTQQRKQFDGLLQKKDDDLAQQRQQYESRLAESRSDRADAIASDKQNSLVLQNHLLRIPRLIMPPLKGRNNHTPYKSFINFYFRVYESCSELAYGQIKSRFPNTKTPLRSKYRSSHAIAYDNPDHRDYGQVIPG